MDLRNIIVIDWICKIYELTTEIIEDMVCGGTEPTQFNNIFRGLLYTILWLLIGCLIVGYVYMYSKSIKIWAIVSGAIIAFIIVIQLLHSIGEWKSP